MYGRTAILAVEVIYMQPYLQTYGSWRETCIVLHLTTQMMGKVKLELLNAQPEWNQVTLDVIPNGFTTGFIAHGDGGFELRLHVDEPRVEATSTAGDHASFRFERGLSIADYHRRFIVMLDAIGHPISIYPVPQETFTQTPFYALTEPLAFDGESARRHFKQCLFARGALMDFTAPFRGKKMLPALFWGTFDLSAVLFSGKPCAFPEDGSMIERVAFDEQFAEFGFWPGGEDADDPAFFVLAYPFLDGAMPAVPPRAAYYDAAQAEYFLRLEDVLHDDDPHGAVTGFFREAFDRIAQHQQWDNLAWLTKPLLIPDRL